MRSNPAKKDNQKVTPIVEARRFNKHTIINTKDGKRLNTVTYYPELAKIIGVNAAVLFSQLSYWMPRKSGDFLIKSDVDLIDELGMSKHEVKTGKRKCKDLGIVDFDNKTPKRRVRYTYVASYFSIIPSAPESGRLKPEVSIVDQPPLVAECDHPSSRVTPTQNPVHRIPVDYSAPHSGSLISAPDSGRLISETTETTYTETTYKGNAREERTLDDDVIDFLDYWKRIAINGSEEAFARPIREGSNGHPVEHLRKEELQVIKRLVTLPDSCAGFLIEALRVSAKQDVMIDDNVKPVNLSYYIGEKRINKLEAELTKVINQYHEFLITEQPTPEETEGSSIEAGGYEETSGNHSEEKSAVDQLHASAVSDESEGDYAIIEQSETSQQEGEAQEEVQATERQEGNPTAVNDEPLPPEYEAYANRMEDEPDDYYFGVSSFSANTEQPAEEAQEPEEGTFTDQPANEVRSVNGAQSRPVSNAYAEAHDGEPYVPQSENKPLDGDSMTPLEKIQEKNAAIADGARNRIEKSAIKKFMKELNFSGAELDQVLHNSYSSGWMDRLAIVCRKKGKQEEYNEFQRTLPFTLDKDKNLGFLKVFGVENLPDDAIKKAESCSNQDERTAVLAKYAKMMKGKPMPTVKSFVNN